ncbi:MAG: zinc-binding alcohol dehydrogenase [Spirochaetes bacterium]|nr:zinc-binding alcohol dehydrogenase [Spirochaetota bacterium]
MATRVVFTGKSEGHIEEFTPPKPGAGQVGIATQYSLMSTGTENIVFNRLFEPGSHWDRWVKYPFFPGYANVGVVDAVGEGVTNLKKGDVVVTRSNHASYVTADTGRCTVLPDASIDRKEAAWFALAKICAMGVRAAQYGLADSVLVIGAGPIGQMSVRWAHALGAETIIAVDLVKSRLDFAQKGGAHHVFDKPVTDCAAEIKALTNGEGPRIVIDSTGNEKVFASALGVVRKYGRVVILGDTGTPSAQHLTADVITRGITIVGAHDGHEDPTWNTPIILRFFFNLLRTKRFDLSGLITHEFAAKDAMKGYEVANTKRNETMGILFDWTK